MQNFEADPSLGLCEIVIKHLLGCALEFNWIPILQVAVNCCPWLEENYLAIGLQLFVVKDWDNYSDIVGVSLSVCTQDVNRLT